MRHKPHIGIIAACLSAASRSPAAESESRLHQLSAVTSPLLRLACGCWPPGAGGWGWYTCSSWSSERVAVIWLTGRLSDQSKVGEVTGSCRLLKASGRSEASLTGLVSASLADRGRSPVRLTVFTTAASNRHV